MKMQESVLRRVRMVEDKKGIRYAKTDGKLYKAMRVLYTVVFAYTMAINLLFISGMLLVYGGTDSFSAIVSSLISVSACTVIIIAGFVLSFFKFKLASGIMSVAAEIFLVPVFGAVMRDELGVMGFTASFYWRHLIPLLLLIVLITASTVIAVRADVKTKKQYKKVTENLFLLYSEKGEDISDEQWQEFLNSYDPTDYTKIFKANEQNTDDENVGE